MDSQKRSSGFLNPNFLEEEPSDIDVNFEEDLSEAPRSRVAQALGFC